jgi:hypothetical protein
MYEVLIEKQGTRFFLPDHVVPTVELGLDLAKRLGEDHSNAVEFIRFVNVLCRRNLIAEPAGRPLRRRGGSSGAGAAKKARGPSIIFSEPERDVPPPTFPKPPPKPTVLVPPTPAPQRHPTVVPQSASPTTRPVVVRAVDTVRLTVPIAQRIKLMTCRFGLQLYGGLSAPTKDQLALLFPTVEAYNLAFDMLVMNPIHHELILWHWNVLACERASPVHAHSMIKIQIEQDMYRYSANPKHPWAFAAQLWSKFMRKTGCPKTIWEVRKSVRLLGGSKAPVLHDDR